MSLPAGMAELLPWLRIPSISGDQRFGTDLLAAARWLRGWLSAAGAEVQSLPTPAAPVIVGRFQGARRGPAALLYGHYDVQPPGPGWRTPPFQPTLRGGRLLARGASDDKGQLLLHLLALRDLARRGRLGCDVVVVAEGAEEIGSPGLAAAMRRLPLHPRAVVVSDTQRFDHRTPAVTVSQRGLVKLVLKVDVGGSAVHPGRYAGAVVDPSLELAAVLVRLRDVIAGLPGTVSPVPGRRPLLEVPDSRLVSASGGRAPVSRSGRHAWLTTHGTVAVSRLRAGDAAAAVPTAASAVVDVRLPPGVDPAPTARLLTTLARAGCRPPTRIELAVIGLARGMNRLPEKWILDAAEAASLVGFGQRPGYVRSGGSVPAIWQLAERFGVIPLLWGLGPPDDGAHGPNEYFDVDGWLCSSDACMQLWQSITEASESPVGASASNRRRESRPASRLRGQP